MTTRTPAELVTSQRFIRNRMTDSDIHEELRSTYHASPMNLEFKELLRVELAWRNEHNCHYTDEQYDADVLALFEWVKNGEPRGLPRPPLWHQKFPLETNSEQPSPQPLVMDYQI